MVKITDYNGKVHYVAPEAIAKISEAGTSSQWHGIKCFVRCFDGSSIEARDSAEDIALRISQQIATEVSRAKGEKP